MGCGASVNTGRRESGAEGVQGNPAEQLLTQLVTSDMSRFASKELQASAQDAAKEASASDGNGLAAETSQKLVLERVCSSVRDEWHADEVDSLGKQLRLSIVVFGASGDLAKKKTYPALYELFKKGFLPRRLQIVGYARSRMSTQDLRDRLRPHLSRQPAECECVEQFLNSCSYLAGEYDAPAGYEALGAALTAWEATMCRAAGGGGG
ncbi:hypothetical protein Agub_g3455, partial [Astrephomene gubernaculifera]